MNKKFKLILLNNQTQANYSLSINMIIGYCFFLFVFLMLCFSLFGIFRFIHPHAKQEKINNMYTYKYNTEDIINNFQLNGLNDSNIVNQYNLQQEYLDLIPNNLPVMGVVTRGLSNKKISPHNGIDIAAKSNSKVKAAQEGMIIFSNFLSDYGNTIIIAHPNNYYSIYSHLKKSLFKERTYVSANQTIGHVGQTGNSKAPHLHFEIWKNHHIIDPRDLIKEYEIRDVSIK